MYSVDKRSTSSHFDKTWEIDVPETASNINGKDQVVIIDVSSPELIFLFAKPPLRAYSTEH